VHVLQYNDQNLALANVMEYRGGVGRRPMGGRAEPAAEEEKK